MSRFAGIASCVALAAAGLVGPAAAAQAAAAEVPIVCTQEGYFPNPNDPRKFVRCVDFEGKGQSFTVFHFECGEGTVWDEEITTCNYPR
ncbi:chitin binding peritrophin-A domain-containing protein [Streptomyces lavendulae]|uniref:chitin binding peritrophin-A domain-containing protein n=1 Tax=Streptomyces lavendulae TaxID=1914 RepID=UPI00331EA091